jgi:hypothetical protein
MKIEDIMPEFLYKVDTEKEVIGVFDEIAGGVSLYCKPNISIIKDWGMLNYHVYVNTSYERKYRLACIIFHENLVKIRHVNTLDEYVFEYSSPKCNAEEIAKILDTWVHIECHQR